MKTLYLKSKSNPSFTVPIFTDAEFQTSCLENTAILRKIVKLYKYPQDLFTEGRV